MAQLVPVQQAAINALATWLTTRLSGTGIEVKRRWTEPDKLLPAKCITIIPAGARKDELLDPVVISQTTDIGTGITTYVYRLRCVTQPLQLDVWSTYAPVRDDILALLDGHLNVGEAVTLGIAGRDVMRQGLLLPLSDGWSGYADICFDEPSYFDTPDSAQVKEFRASYRGEANIDLTVTATAPKLATIILRQTLHESALGTALPQTGTDVATVTAAGETYTHTTP